MGGESDSLGGLTFQPWEGRACGFHQFNSINPRGTLMNSLDLHHHHASHAHHRHCATSPGHATASVPAHEVSGNHGSLNRLAFSATLHCLTGCSIGEILGMVIGIALGFSAFATIALAITLAFLFGYAFTIWPLRRAGMSWKQAGMLALAADTASITIMEIVNNGVMLAIPGAMDASLGSAMFWGSMTFAIAIAGVAAFPVNRWLIARGRGHAIVHAHH